MKKSENFDTRLKAALNKSLYQKTKYRIVGSVAYSSIYTRIYNAKKNGEDAAVKVILVEKQREHNVYQHQDLSESERRCDPKDSYDHELHALQSLRNIGSLYAVEILSDGNVVDFEDWEVYYFIMKKYSPLIDTRGTNKQAIFNPLMNKWIAEYGRNDTAAYLGCCITNAFLEMRKAHIENNRDIKPENLYLANNEEDMFLNRFILGDFGESHPESSVITTAQAHIGTKEYIPGNQEPNTSWKYDQFMLGVTMYEIFNGTPLPPYERRSEDENMRYAAWADGTAPIPAPVKYEIDEDLFAIIKRMTMYDPDKRYDSIDELKNDLAGVIKNKEFSEKLNSGNGYNSKKKSKKSFLIKALCAVLVIAVICSSVFFGINRKRNNYSEIPFSDKNNESQQTEKQPAPPAFAENAYSFKTISGDHSEIDNYITIGDCSVFLIDSLIIHTQNGWIQPAEETNGSLVSVAFDGKTIVYSFIEFDTTDYHTAFYRYDIEQYEKIKLFDCQYDWAECVYFDESVIYYHTLTDSGYVLFRFDLKTLETEMLIQGKYNNLPETKYVFSNNKSYLLIYETDESSTSWNHLTDSIDIYCIDDRQFTDTITLSSSDMEFNFVDYIDDETFYYRTRFQNEDENQTDYQLFKYNTEKKDKQLLLEFSLPTYFTEDPDLYELPYIENTSRFLYYKYDSVNEKIFYYDVAEEKSFSVESNRFDYLLECGENLVGVLSSKNNTYRFYFMNNYSFDNVWVVEHTTNDFSENSTLTKNGFYYKITTLSGIADYSFEEIDFTGETNTE